MNVGVILKSLYGSQLAFELTKQLNRMNGCVFVENTSPITIPCNFSIFDLHRLWRFEGMAVATTLASAKVLAKARINAHKVFYIWYPEFLTNKDFEYNVEIYRDEELTLFTRSEPYADIIENYANRRPIVIPNINLDRIKEHFNGQFTETSS